MSKLPLLAACLAVLAGPLRAEAPQVVTDIAPVHALTAQVMDGMGAPVLLVKPGLSPHSYALRPSQARALQEADLVVWIGEGLTPWLEKPLASLAGQAGRLELMEAEGTLRLPYRGADDVLKAAEAAHGDHEGRDHEGRDHEAGGGQEDPHADAHGHEAAHGDHDHHAGAYDPHAWLDPQNGIVWLDLIADRLAARDPENAALYRRNAAAGQAEIEAVMAELAETLRPMRGVPFVSYHDGFRYFEDRFGLTLAGTVTPGDATDPSPAQLAQLRDRLVDLGVACAFAEPQFDTRLLEAALAGRDIPILELDPIGRAHAPGPALYPALLRDLGAGFAACAPGG